MLGQTGGDPLWVPTGPPGFLEDRPSGPVANPGLPPGRGGRALGCPMTGDSARCPGTACDGRTAPLWPFLDFLKLQCQVEMACRSPCASGSVM